MTRNRLITDIKRGALLLIILLGMALYPINVEAADVPDYIEIGLKYGNDVVSQSIISPDGFILGSVSQDGFTESLPLPGYQELVASVQDGHVELRDSGGVLISADIGTNGCLMPYGDGDHCILSVDGQKYRGGVLLKVKNKALTVINYLTMNEYLYGVIHREMGQGNPMEALKAQAISARTFTVVNRGRHYEYGFDLCTTTHCQVYGGCKEEYESTSRAVDETDGMIIRYQGEPAEIYYHKNSGGHTQNSEDEWSTRTPYLRGVPDAYSPEYPWRATINFDVLQQKLTQAQLDPGTVKSVEIGGRDGSGAVSSLVIKGDKGEVELTKSRIRVVLGNSLVRSRHFSIGDTYEGSLPSGSGMKLTLLSAHGTKTLTDPDTIHVLSDRGLAQAIDVTSLSATKGSGAAKIEAPVKEPGVFDDSNTAHGSALILTGKGYGHGVGMSQDGAIEMAKQGMDYMDILDYYFTNIEVN